MGFFFRRSTNIGPFRLNFSKSGIGASVGVKGARLTMNPRGTTYITVGGHGFYYRETLSNRGRNTSTPPPLTAPPATDSSDKIVTADVSDLVDSSSETLIQRLNERARMFNPAWILYGVAVVTLLINVASRPPLSAPVQRDLPDVSLPFSSERQNNTVDEYSMIVSQYGYPDSVLATRLGMISVRTAVFSSIHTKLAFVSNGCVGAYEEVERALVEKSKHGVRPKRQIENHQATCGTAPENGWTIVRYANSFDDSTISGADAKNRLDVITVKRNMPPVIEAQSLPASKNRPKARLLPEKDLHAKSDKAAAEQTWAVQNQISQRADVDARSPLSTYALLLGAVGLFVAGIFVHKKNAEKRISRLFYELNPTEQEKYSVVQAAFGHLAKSQRVWRVEGRSATTDWKHHAGASTLVRRVPIGVGSSNPPRVQTNVWIPCIDTGPAKLFFLPDVILYLERGTYGGISYDDFRVEHHFTRFVEDERPPGDATVVDRTWRFPNKNGGPDRRFNNNVQLPVMRYGELILTSSRGVNIHLDVSNAEESLTFANCWVSLHNRPGAGKARQSQTQSERGSPSSPDEQALKMLGLTASASPGEISNAYRHLAQMYHPDKVSGLAPEFQILADKRMREINAAYEVLKQRPVTG